MNKSTYQLRGVIISSSLALFVLSGCSSESADIDQLDDSNIVASALETREDSFAKNVGFFADRLGGGPEDVLERRLIDKIYRIRSNQDIVLPNSNGVYEFTADNDAIINMPYEVEESSSDIVEDAEGNLKIGKGRWKIRPNRNGREQADLEEVYIEYDDSSVALTVSTEETSISSGSRVLVKASLHRSNSENSLNDLSKVNVTVTEYLNGSKKQSKKQLRDRGTGGDDSASDGIYSGYINLTKAGKHALHVEYTAVLEGEPISRSTVVRSFVSDHRIKVSESRVTAINGMVGETPLEEGRLGISIGVKAVKGDIPDLVNTYAEIWGINGAGDDVVVGWIGGLVQPIEERKGSSLPMTFHSGWLELDDYEAPYTLRGLEVYDVDNLDQILVDGDDIQIDDLFLTSQKSFLKSESGSSNTATRDMERGVHPDILDGIYRKGNAQDERKIVMSLHGFCDGAKSLGNFSSTIRNKGLEYSGSRNGESAHRYASNVARELGWRPQKLRGIVAHSHGGMVGATLLNNYSYLFDDYNRSRSPNVVTMGTPFWGSGLLEGRLPSFIERALIDLFESVTNCNIPAELYPSRNSSWSNGIGWRAKSQVRAYFTTHTRPKFFENRDCRDRLSIQIRGSDDGVLAPSNGIGFAGGGDVDYHYSGYCHMPGMGQGDQWKHPGFENYVNSIFHNDSELWQPF